MKIKKSLMIILVLSSVLILSACNAVNDSNDTDSLTNDTNNSTTTIDTSSGNVSSFGDISVENIEVNLSDEDWQSMLSDPTAEEFKVASLSYEGTTLNNVAFRTKGNSSLINVAKSDSERYGFKIKTNKYVDGQYLNGTNEFVLNASYSDPSYLREYLTYSLSENLGLYTPDTKFVWLIINGQDYGLYLYVESYDDTFISERTSSDDTNLYKADGENCTLTLKDGISGFELKEGDDDDMTNITNLITVLNQTTSENKEKLEEILNVESVLKWTALSYVTGNYDSYIGSKAHNYYLLYTDGKMNMVGWDYNMSFGGFPEDSGSSLLISAESPFSNTTASDRPLVSKLLEIDSYKKEYLGYVDDLKAELSIYLTELPTLAENIQSYVSKDPTAFYTLEEFNNEITGSDMTLSDLKANNSVGNFPPTDRPIGGDLPIPDNGMNTNKPGGNSQGIGESNTITLADYIRLRLK